MQSAIDGFYDPMIVLPACYAVIGFDAKVAHEFAAPAKRGLMTICNRLICKNFFRYHPLRFELRVMDK